METSKKDFAIFKTEAKKWIEIFGLKNWNIHFVHKTKTVSSFASYRTSAIYRTGIIFLSKEWNGYEVTEHQLKSSALHEVIHILFSRLSMLAIDRPPCERDINEEEHNIINILQNVLGENKCLKNS